MVANLPRSRATGLSQHRRRLDHAKRRVEHHRLGHLAAKELQAPRSRFMSIECGAGEIENVDLHSADGQAIPQTLKELLSGCAGVMRGVEQVHTEHAQRLGLLRGGVVHQVDVKQQVAGLTDGSVWKRRPIHPCCSLSPLKLRVATVLAKAKKRDWLRATGPGDRPSACTRGRASLPVARATRSACRRHTCHR